MASVQIMYWYDIPVQVRAGGRRDRASIELPQRFQLAVDNAAMEAGLTGTDAYLAGFIWGEPVERDGSPAEAAAMVALEIEATYSTIEWRRTAAKIKENTANR